ncbi:MAG TPA: ribosomal-processing cysteine protease Prp [Caproicibacter sp.]|nr:ribosomal-processing cysteine protease Prp [Caproicibacter sp.]
MIRAEFFTKNGQPNGFRVSGHSGSSEAGTDIICAAVSSAAYMAANTITDVIGVPAEISVEDGLMLLKIPAEAADSCGALLQGFRLHMAALKEQYPKNIELTDTEV